MLLHVPASLDELLSLFAGCFTKPTLQTFRALVVGQVSQVGLRTVTGMLVGARLSGVWDYCRTHRFFSRARWSADELGLRLAELIAARLAAPGAPLLVAIDDTLAHRLGRKIHGCFWHHDATANSDRAALAWGNNWVVAGIVVRLPFLERAVCLPVLFRLWRPKRAHIAKDKPDPERPAKPALARELIDLLAARLRERRIDLVGDAAYAAGAWRGLPGRVTLTSRLRSNAAIYARTPPPTGKRGRPAKWGRRLSSLAQIALDEATAWAPASVRRYGKTETLMLATIDWLWGPLGAETPVRVILVQDSDKPCGYQLALISTDLQATPAQLVQRYAHRWPIEVAFEEENSSPASATRATAPAARSSAPSPSSFSARRSRSSGTRSQATTPTSSPSTAPARPGTRPRPRRRSPTCSPSSAARSSPPNITQDSVTPPHQRKSPRSKTHGPRPDSKRPKSSLIRL